MYNSRFPGEGSAFPGEYSLRAAARTARRGKYLERFVLSRYAKREPERSSQ